MIKHAIRSNSLILLCALALPSSIYSQAKKEDGVWNRLKNATVYLAGAYGTNLAFVAMHELGHIAAAKLALHAQCNTACSKTADLKFWYFGLNAKYPEFDNAKVDTFANIAGPIAGLIGVYCALKCINIYNESKKSNNLKQAIKKGLKKNLLNDEQSVTLRALALAHVAGNLADLIPFKAGPFETSGAKVWEKLRAQEPK